MFNWNNCNNNNNNNNSLTQLAQFMFNVMDTLSEERKADLQKNNTQEIQQAQMKWDDPLRCFC